MLQSELLYEYDTKQSEIISLIFHLNVLHVENYFK
jgi:hypothetical protein